MIDSLGMRRLPMTWMGHRTWGADSAENCGVAWTWARAVVDSAGTAEKIAAIPKLERPQRRALFKPGRFWP